MKNTAAVGQVVEFVTSHPSAPGRRIRGLVRDVGSRLYPCNPQVSTSLGGHELLRSEWGTSVTVIKEGVTYADFVREFAS